MQVTAINTAYSGMGRQAQPDVPPHAKASRSNFDEFLSANGSSHAPQTDTGAAQERALARLQVLVGQELAERAVNDDGSINPVRLAQAMISADAPYGMPDRYDSAIAPRFVNMIA